MITNANSVSFHLNNTNKLVYVLKIFRSTISRKSYIVDEDTIALLSFKDGKCSLTLKNKDFIVTDLNINDYISNVVIQNPTCIELEFELVLDHLISAINCKNINSYKIYYSSKNNNRLQFESIN